MPNPIQGAKVEIYKNNRLIDYRYTDATGSCSFNLPQDTYKIKVTKENYMPHEQTITLNTDIIKTVYLEKKPYKLIETLMRARLVDAISVKEKGVETKILTVTTTRLSDRISISERPLVRIPTPTSTHLSDSINVSERIEQKVVTVTPTQLSDNINVSEYVTNASGIDPNDPEWRPEDGWTTIWEFKDPAELNDFANYSRFSASVENDKLIFNPPEGDYGQAYRIVSSIYRKVAVCLKVKVLQVADIEDMILHTAVADGSNEYTPSLYTVANDTTKLKLLNGSVIIFDNPEDWIVYVSDIDNGTIRIYDKNKNVLAETEQAPAESTELGSMIRIIEDNYPTSALYVVTDVEVDWIAVKE